MATWRFDLSKVHSGHMWAENIRRDLRVHIHAVHAPHFPKPHHPRVRHSPPQASQVHSVKMKPHKTQHGRGYEI